jgi:hypothetical protein
MDILIINILNKPTFIPNFLDQNIFNQWVDHDDEGNFLIIFLFFFFSFGH